MKVNKAKQLLIKTDISDFYNIYCAIWEFISCYVISCNVYLTRRHKNPMQNMAAFEQLNMSGSLRALCICIYSYAYMYTISRHHISEMFCKRFLKTNLLQCCE